MRGRRKANGGHLLTDDNVLLRCRNNCGGVPRKGPRIPICCACLRTASLFKVDKTDATTLSSLIAKTILPSASVNSDEWATCHCIPSFADATRSPLNLELYNANNSVNFIDPTKGANGQRIESGWRNQNHSFATATERISLSSLLTPPGSVRSVEVRQCTFRRERKVPSGHGAHRTPISHLTINRVSSAT
ncbi:hypothetical protein HPB51_020711 [Rhipicephalus microplus]|uniref:Uncharacterized protein n=1 Tax=Rhipicephalus microplus TaxID=6941 RepID=A0A9J6EI94_RHIMP|nr:hypothetical protein HPB51_020711 [Rhipicephalus microplus]